jgi:hypothetical protein
MKTHRRATASLAAAIVVLASACGGSDESASTPASTAATPKGSPATTATPTTSPAVGTVTTTASTTTPTTALSDDAWTVDVEAACAEVAPMAVDIVPNSGTEASMTSEITATRAVFDVDAFGSLTVPADVQPVLDRVQTLRDEGVAQLDDAAKLVATGDLGAAQRAIDEGFDRLVRTATAWAIAGAPCAFADPVLVANADLTVPLELAPWQITAAFDSIWVSELQAAEVVRLDPATGNVLARIQVADGPVKAQPADGRLLVRTTSTYDAIDPTSNAVVASITKAEVGPSANRSWAVDGAFWICDGQRLHRYDPTTLTPVATLELGIDCEAVTATDALVVAWNYNEDPGESDESVVSIIDAATNEILQTIDLPVDVGGPVVLPDTLYFPGELGPRAVVVDRTSWKVVDTPAMGGGGGGTGQAVVDGDTIYVVNDTEDAVLLIDAASFEPIDTIEPLGVNALATLDGSLWTAAGSRFDAVQRFDRS